MRVLAAMIAKVTLATFVSLYFLIDFSGRADARGECGANTFVRGQFDTLDPKVYR